MKKNHICIITGARSDYAYLKPIIEKINDSSKLEMSLIVTGIHLLEKYGYSYKFIEKDGFLNSKIVHMYDSKDTSQCSLGKAVGNAIIKFTKCFYKLNPDIILVLGDRFEALAAVVAASTLSKVIAHVHGGDDVSQGQVDEQIRHSITKLAHIHFPATPKSAERIKLMGEQSWRIHMVGSPTIDEIRTIKILSKEDLFHKFQLNPLKSTVFCVQHPYIVESNKAGEQMAITLQVLKDIGIQSIILYPNNDPGSNLIINEIESYRSYPKFKIFKNVERKDYLSILKHVDLMVGNSSSGLIETPIFKLPTVNIGDRNKGRESAENVVNVPPKYENIKRAIDKTLSKDFKAFCQTVKNPYGDGKASEKITKILEDLEISKDLLIKRLTYKV